MSERSTPEADQEFKTKIIVATAIRQAMFEFIGEHRDQIAERAKAKLVALGIEVEDAEIKGQL